VNWSKQKVLVTGASGFIGSHLVTRLVEQGASVRALIKYNSRNDWGLLEFLPEISQAIETIQGDLREASVVRRAVQGTEVVFHLGAIISIPYSYQNPSEVVEANVMGTLNVLNAAREYGIPRVIHTSSSEVYGTAQYVPIDESHPLQGQSPYSASKIAADKLAESFHASYNLPVGIVRPFNTYGPRQSSRAVIPTIITQALTKGTVYLGSLHPTRDFTYVEDTVNGFIKAAESLSIIGHVVNLGSGQEISIGELATRIFRLMGQEPRIVADDTRIRPEKSEVERLLANNAKAKSLIGWEPQISFDEGLHHTIEWLRKHLTLYKTNIYNV
jgi:dTDP-glucose 4,6-dehydratase